MEICPNRIRGGMVTFQAVWSNMGGIACAVMMQQLNSKYPDNYLLAMKILWAPIVVMIICCKWAILPIPESLPPLVQYDLRSFQNTDFEFFTHRVPRS